QGGDYGVAILSKLPVKDFRNVPAYKTGTYGTTHAYVKVALDDDTHIWFNSSHFSTDLVERTVHVQEAVNYYKTVLKREPLIIAGDLNAQLPDSEMQLLQEEFAESDVSLSNTFSTRSGMRSKIDFIMYPKTGQWKVLSFKRICRPDASDHCAVLAELEYTKPN
ncbi:MAG TPA: endonuclease/exonuclease/phosphatase family protein, partial [Sphingobacterium sp.]|nr:endonuclease/exonuclease/phosphatase family protein [Sphingobacterium sp.]